MITTDTPAQQALIDKFTAARQGHVFKHWQDLDTEGREQLLQQLAGIDLDLLTTLKDKFIHGRQTDAVVTDLQPAGFVPVPSSPQEKKIEEQMRTVGEQALRANRVGAFLVAGGQGSRLGFPGPKGKYPISPVRQKTLFQLHAEKILTLSKKYNCVIPWYIMTSETNHAETLAFFEENGFFGLVREDVMFFSQEMVPALDENGKLFLEAPDRIFRNPNGHGGSLAALASNGALADMESRGVDLIFYFQVDNVLVNICDPVFLGHHVRAKAEMSAKVVVKIDADEKVGVLAKMQGRLGVIEYSDLPDEEKRSVNTDGSLKFRAGNIAIHIFDRTFVERETEGGLQLPWHVAHKKIVHLAEDGQRVDPQEPNGYKFETFVFDALGDAERTVFLEVKREEEFSPVKNAEGADSPATAQRDMIKQFQRWLTAAGVASQDITLEISPLFALGPDDLRNKMAPDLHLGETTYLG